MVLHNRWYWILRHLPRWIRVERCRVGDDCETFLRVSF